MSSFRKYLSETNNTSGLYAVKCIGNFWGGSRYEQGLDLIYVLANSPEEAKKIAENNIDTVTEHFKNKILKGKKRALAKSDNVKVKIGVGMPKLTTNTSFHKTLTKSGKFENINLKNLKESKVDYLEVLNNSIGASDKMDQDMWEWFMDNLGDSNIYAGDAVPEDYLEIMTDKQAKELYKFLSKKYKKVLDSNMNESNDLSKYKSKVAKWIDDNNNIEVRALMVKLVGDKRLTKVVDGINAIVNYETHNPISEYTQEIYTLLNNMGRKKYGENNWNTNIYNP